MIRFLDLVGLASSVNKSFSLPYMDRTLFQTQFWFYCFLLFRWSERPPVFISFRKTTAWKTRCCNPLQKKWVAIKLEIKITQLKVGLKIAGVVEIKNKMLRWAAVNLLLILRGGDIRLNLSSAFHDNELALFNTSLY